MCMTVLKVCIVNIIQYSGVLFYVTEMYVNCGSRNVRCTIYKVELISLAFKWLIILRSAIETQSNAPSP